MTPSFNTPWWLPRRGALGGHVQSIVPALWSRDAPPGVVATAPVGWTRARWDTPDGDFIDVDTLAAPVAAGAPTLVLFHGLEGSSRSHYVRAFAHWARSVGWRLVVPHFRGCSGEINRTARAYHSGDHAEVDFILRSLRAAHSGPLLAVGVSLGGNALMRWAGEHGLAAVPVVHAVAAICSPLDLVVCGEALGRGFNRISYTPMFLRTMQAKARLKAEQFPDAFDLKAALAARDLRAFDDAFTAPLHGFTGVMDYWQRASAKPHLPRVAVPALLLNALNDPFVPAGSLPRADEVSERVTLWQPAHGGHVGFASGARPPGHLGALPQQVGAWLQAQLVTGGAGAAGRRG